MDKLGWIVIAVFVLVFDILAVLSGKKTLSAGWEEIRKDPRKAAVLAILWTALTAHLFKRTECYHEIVNNDITIVDAIDAIA